MGFRSRVCRLNEPGQQFELVLASLPGAQSLIGTDRRHHEKVRVHCPLETAAERSGWEQEGGSWILQLDHIYVGTDSYENATRHTSSIKRTSKHNTYSVLLEA